MKNKISEELLKIADQHAMDFAEWLGLNCYKAYSKYRMYDRKEILFTLKEVLEIYNNK